MSHQSMMQKATLFIVLLIVLAFVVSDISHGNPRTLARKVYNKHTQTLTRADVLEVLPDVLNELRTPKVQRLLNDRNIKLIVNNPDLLKTFLPDISDKFIRLLKTDAQIKKLIRDADFQKVLQDPAAINALVALMTGDTQPEEAQVTFGDYAYRPLTVDGERLYLSSDSLFSNVSYRPGSKHEIIITVRKRQSRTPVQGVRLTLSTDRSSTTTATFKPATITTDKNGKAKTEITLGKKPGNLSIFVELQHEGSRVTFGGYAASTLFVDGERLDVRLEGLSSNTPYRPGSNRKVTFTVTKERTRKPVPSVRLSLSKQPGSKAPLIFRPTVITTDKNGKAETQITLPKQPGSVFEIRVAMEYERGVIYEKMYSHVFSVDGEKVYMTHDLRSDFAYHPGSKHKVTFTVTKQGTRKPVSGVRLTLRTHHDSTTTATFKPTTITTDRNGKAETQITFGKKSGSVSISVRMQLDKTTWAVFTGFGYSTPNLVDGKSSVDGKTVNLKHDLRQTNYRPGSKHKLILTLTYDQTGKPVPAARLTLSTTTRGATATFKPTTITTDRNGKAETQITFGKKPGEFSIYVNIRTAREAVFSLRTPGVSGGPRIEMNITLDGTSRTLSRHSDFSYGLGLTKTRKRLVVKTHSNQQRTKPVPYVDLVFNAVGRQSKASVTFEPKKVRTDRNGQSVTYVTFGQGQTDVQIQVQVNMVLVAVVLNETSNLIPIPFLKVPSEGTHIAEVVRGVNGMRNLRFHANGRSIPSFVPDSVVPVTDNWGVFPLNASARFQFEPHLDNIRAKSPLFFIDVIGGGRYIKLNRGYATGSGGLVTVQMNTRSEPGVVMVNLNPPNAAQLKGTIRITGRESVFGKPTFDNVRNLSPLTIVSQEKFKHRYKRIGGRVKRVAGIAANSVRVEVDIRSRKISSTGVEIGAYAKLYEGRAPDTDDLDDADFTIVTLPWDDPLAPSLMLWNNDANSLGFSAGPAQLEAARVLGLSHVWKKITYDKHRNDHVHVSLSLEAIPIYKGNLLTSAFGAPAAVPLNRFSFSDVNLDGQVNVTDLILVSNTLEQTDWSNLRADVNDDGIFTITDLIQVAHDLGQSTGSNTPAALAVPERLTYATVEGWIASARAVDDGSLVFRHGIANLERLLTLIIPEKTGLLANYPNPFNPETWIPYHLAKPADVTLSIYAADGKLIRTLALGHQPAGIYESKIRAAYWDGRNDFGERVASGLYFYTLTAGDFATTRKMLILK